MDYNQELLEDLKTIETILNKYKTGYLLGSLTEPIYQARRIITKSIFILNDRINQNKKGC